MKIKKYTNIFILLVCVLVCSKNLLSDESRLVGQVLFALGSVYSINPAAEKKVLQRGVWVYEGDTIITGARGKIGLRMVDGAIEKIGNNSVFSIIKYQYDQHNPQNSIIKMELKKGKLFSKTGKGGEAAKNNYRLNTPIAAIGIRGTEYTVFTDNKITKVNVLSGGVIMSSFGISCRKEGFAVCTGDNVMVLMAEQRQKMLLLKLGQKRPILVPSTSNNIEGEQQNNLSPTPANSSKNDQEQGNTVDSQSRENIDSTHTSSVTWGRWKPDSDATSSIEEQLANGYELISQSGDFAIIRRENEVLNLPNTGLYHFTPKSYGAVVRNSENNTYQNAEVIDPSLIVDFTEKAFSTSFTLRSEDLVSNVEANGSLDETGVFTDDGSNPETKIKGAVAGEQANEAAYSFFHQINDSYTAAGAIEWSTKR